MTKGKRKERNKNINYEGKGDEGVGARRSHSPADQGPNHVMVERQLKRNAEGQSPK